ncbi:MAG TPA: endonuclease MutS2 [Gemmatimonadaceae bacterium]|nr:endonuclease MutS2 [Gemmatimonadaceae bacterium]
MNAHALAVLEFQRTLDVVAGNASSPAGAAHVRELRPSDDVGEIEREHARVTAMRALVTAEAPWSPEPVPDVARALERLRVLGTALPGAELLGALVLLRSSRRTAEALRDPRRPVVATAVLSTIAASLVSAKQEEAALERVLADDGTVRDDASPALRRLRRELRGAEAELVRLLERIMARLESHQQVSDMSVTVRNGRYVIPVRREARGAVGGIVHDTSGSGATLFVEPPAAVEEGNRIRELEIEEVREVDRILLEATDRIRPMHDEMVAALHALVMLDSLYGRARYAVAYQCAHAELTAPADGFAIRSGRHPLLLAQGIDVVPFDLEMHGDERTLLVSGPNTGGKTVLLKSLALISALVQSGVPAPVAVGSRIAVFDDLFADIGDEQSIEASLSTFSAHLKNLGEILRAATPSSLVLIDELGSGTDPIEGAALGGAILEELTRRGALTIATTHLGALKELATEVPGVVNASLQFDAGALAPTYRLIKGVPGRSYGISIARRLGLRADVLDRAEERVPKGERDVNRLLADLEARETELTARERDVTLGLESVQARAHRVAEREAKIKQRERELERESRAGARRYLLEARAEIEQTIRDLRKAGAAGIEEQARQARQGVERTAAEHGEALAELDRREASRRGRDGEPASADDGEPNEGDLVEIETLGGRLGRLIEWRDGDAIVAVGGVKMTLPQTALRRTLRQEPKARETVPIMGDMPDEYVAREIDLRGQRVGDIDDAVMQALDAAVRADLKAIRIIHGKGTGALRARVAEMLRKDTRVKTFRLGAWNEGGTGVTVAEFA